MNNRKANISKWLIILSILEGFLAIGSLFQVPSEAQNAVLWGLSASRIAILLACLVLQIALFILLVVSQQRNRTGGFHHKLKTQHVLLILRIVFAFLVLVLCCCLAIFLLKIVDQQNLETLTDSIVSRYWGILIWGTLLSVQLGIVIQIEVRRLNFTQKEFFSPIFQFILFAIFVAIFYAGFSYYEKIDWSRNLHNPGAVFIPVVAAALLGVICHSSIQSDVVRRKVDQFWISIFLGSLIFSIYRLSGYCFKRLDTPAKAYWDVLADAFNHEKLYLTNPATFHDLTLYDGNWFVPNPPLPAILLMPFVKWLGVDGVNMTVVSSLLGAGNAVLIYWILKRASDLGMIRCNQSTIYWLVIVFALGTNHFWLSLDGQMWFVSQLVAVSMVALATLSVISGWSGWLVGLFLGLALLARPNIFPTVFLLVGSQLWKEGTFPGFHWKKMLQWGIKIAIPVVVCSFLLLYYNYVRFEDWFDFGYVTINGAPWIIEAVQRYGMFNAHFFRTNLNVMLCKLPRLDFSGTRFFFQPGISGYSIFVMTPPLLSLYRSFRKNWWVIGAWLSVILILFLLLFYHNTGAEQVGYRYLMDAIIPIMLLMGLGVGEKAGIVFKGLTLLGVVINLLSTYWWFIARV